MQVNTSPAGTGPGTTLTPRSLEVLIQHVRAAAPCPHCGSLPGAACKWQGRRGVHLARFIRAYTRRLVTADELAVVLGGLEVFTTATIIRDGAR